MLFREEDEVLPLRDRAEAGQLLATRLCAYSHRADVLVLALPRGGVVVGFEVARALAVPLDIFLVRKLGVPWEKELAIGAIASGGVRVLNQDVIAALGLQSEVIARVIAAEQRELGRRERLYRGDHPASPVAGKTVILVDDGVATGSTMRAATAALRQKHSARIVVAVPVMPAAASDLLRKEADQVICIAEPEPFFAIGQWYQCFTQVTDDEVRTLLERAPAAPRAA